MSKKCKEFKGDCLCLKFARLWCTLPKKPLPSVKGTLNLIFSGIMTFVMRPRDSDRIPARLRARRVGDQVDRAGVAIVVERREVRGDDVVEVDPRHPLAAAADPAADEAA